MNDRQTSPPSIAVSRPADGDLPEAEVGLPKIPRSFSAGCIRKAAASPAGLRSSSKGSTASTRSGLPSIRKATASPAGLRSSSKGSTTSTRSGLPSSAGSSRSPTPLRLLRAAAAASLGTSRGGLRFSPPGELLQLTNSRSSASLASTTCSSARSASSGAAQKPRRRDAARWTMPGQRDAMQQSLGPEDALMNAVLAGDVAEAARVLEEHGQRALNKEWASGVATTVALYAAQMGSLEMCNVLVHHGGLPLLTARDIRGRSAASCAEESGFSELASYLRTLRQELSGDPQTAKWRLRTIAALIGARSRGDRTMARAATALHAIRSCPARRLLGVS